VILGIASIYASGEQGIARQEAELGPLRRVRNTNAERNVGGRECRGRVHWDLSLKSGGSVRPNFWPHLLIWDPLRAPSGDREGSLGAVRSLVAASRIQKALACGPPLRRV